MTNQEAFDQIWNHFIVQKNQPGYDGLKCSYYSTNKGYKCAVGCLMSDRMAKRCQVVYGYEPLVKVLNDRYIKRKLDKVDLAFLCEVQHAHDTALLRTNNFYLALENHLIGIAREFKLKVPKKINKKKHG